MNRGCPGYIDQSNTTCRRYSNSSSSDKGSCGTGRTTPAATCSLDHAPDTGSEGRRSRNSCHRSTARSAKCRAWSAPQSRSRTGSGGSPRAWSALIGGKHTEPEVATHASDPIGDLMQPPARPPGEPGGSPGTEPGGKAEAPSTSGGWFEGEALSSGST